MIRPVVRIRMYALSAAVLLSTAACADRVTGPARALPDAAARSAASSPGELSRPRSFPNTTRYRWHGARPATGRSGTAELTARAMVGRDGKTELELWAGNERYPWWSPLTGSITRVQARITTPDGKHLGTSVHNGLSAVGFAAFSYGGVQPGSVVEVQAAVRGLDGRRTDVVSVTEVVRRRPNLAVRHVSVPARVRQGGVVNVAATIAETNGDVGAWARCTLYRDGTLVDWATSIWVDAGDAVTCAFTQFFTAEGTTELEVRLEDFFPRDDDPGDNSARATVQVAFEPSFFYQAGAYQNAYQSREYETGRWSGPDGTRGEWELENRQESIEQSMNLLAWVPRTLQHPVLSLVERSDGVLVHSLEYDPGPSSGWGGGCPWVQDPASGVSIYLCTSFGSTTVIYARNAGQVTYHSRVFSRTWDGTTGEESVYHYNGGSTGGPWGTLVPFGREYSFNLRVADGEEIYAADPTMTLLDTPGGYTIPRNCVTVVDEWMGGVSETCREYQITGLQREGLSRSFF